MNKHFSIFSAVAAACTLALLTACASDAIGNSPPPVPDSPALAQAKTQQRNVSWNISQSESALRQLSPPIRFTDKGVTTYDLDKQRQYEMNRDRIDRQIRNLRDERLVWDLRVSQIIQQESLMAQQRAAFPVQQAAPVLGPAPVWIGVPPTMIMQENPALTQARNKVRDTGYQIDQGESALRMLSPPIRSSTNGVVTVDIEKQRQYDLERARIDAQLRDLKADRTLWELRVNQLSQ